MNEWVGGWVGGGARGCVGGHRWVERERVEEGCRRGDYMAVGVFLWFRRKVSPPFAMLCDV